MMKKWILIVSLILGISVNAQVYDFENISPKKMRVVNISKDAYALEIDTAKGYRPSGRIPYTYLSVDTFFVEDVNGEKIGAFSDYGFEPSILYFEVTDEWETHNVIRKVGYSFSFPIKKFSKTKEVRARKEGNKILLETIRYEEEMGKMEWSIYLLLVLQMLCILALFLIKINEYVGNKLFILCGLPVVFVLVSGAGLIIPISAFLLGVFIFFEQRLRKKSDKNK